MKSVAGFYQNLYALGLTVTGMSQVRNIARPAGHFVRNRVSRARECLYARLFYPQSAAGNLFPHFMIGVALYVA